ncbi:AGE family epimerase/isomerase [Litoribaculum gwangyangense]|uniref:Cellobiose 2-epimerase n=1 Tax=Litoribaculum gwangyangense TaxID=1130722 RepID=A0ABP9CLB2_9FLAO
MKTAAYLQLKKEMHDELLRILDYWQNNTIDYEHGGFFGKIDFYNKVVPKSSKGIILNTRILWSFSAASNYLKTDTYKEICERSYEYLKRYFKDTKNKGVFWELDYLGQPINKRKQVYAQSFAIYALSEYYIYSGNRECKDWAIELFECIEKYAKDEQYGGYLEAFKEDWSPIEDMRLSDKDMNAAKSMNTHLHVLEAYTALLKIYDNAHLKEALKMLIEIMNNKILNKKYHFDLFFDQKWNLLSYTVSFGHDIESAWLLLRAAEMVNDPVIIEKSKHIAVDVADTFLKHGIDVDGSVLNEVNFFTNHTDTDRHWWPQVEALIGLKEAHSIENKESYIASSVNIWNYTKKHLLDYENGDWHFRVNQKGKPYTQENKVSMWKAPYHTTRACIMINE